MTGDSAALRRPATARSEAASWFDELYRSSIADVHAYVAALLRDRVAAEDVVALAFERAFRHRCLFNAQRGTARAWVFAIARNAALDELRGRRRVAPLDFEVAEGSRSDEGLVDRATVRAGLAKLDPHERELILLKFHGQLTNAELARVLRISESNAGTRLHRAVGRLREECA
ncbi:MAG: RNA polymerase sigma factor [Solirubrobacteraceae bacterium]